VAKILKVSIATLNSEQGANEDLLVVNALTSSTAVTNDNTR